MPLRGNCRVITVPRGEKARGPGASHCPCCTYPPPNFKRWMEYLAISVRSSDSSDATVLIHAPPRSMLFAQCFAHSHSCGHGSRPYEESTNITPRGLFPATATLSGKAWRFSLTPRVKTQQLLWTVPHPNPSARDLPPRDKEG